MVTCVDSSSPRCHVGGVGRCRLLVLFFSFARWTQQISNTRLRIPSGKKTRGVSKTPCDAPLPAEYGHTTRRLTRKTPHFLTDTMERDFSAG